MNKKELNKIKKEFRLDSTLLKIKDIYSVYLKKDNSNFIFSKVNQFERLDTEAQELYMANFKKILGGTLNTKLFQLSFNSMEEASTQEKLYNILCSETEDNMLHCEDIVKKIMENYTYETDVVVTFIKGEYWSGKKVNKEHTLDSEDDIVSRLPFVMGSINKVELFKKTLMFNFEEKEFKPSNILDISINLDAPLNGFLFPSFDQGVSDVNNLMFYNSKPKEINYNFIENVLQCSMKLTAEEEKCCFVDIVKDMVGDSINAEILENIYTRINEIKASDESENHKINKVDLSTIFKDIQVDEPEKLEAAFEGKCGSDYEFSIDNILPDYKSKSLKVWNDDLSISMNPKNINSIRQIKGNNGTRCLLIELEEDIIVDGFKLKTEE